MIQVKIKLLKNISGIPEGFKISRLHNKLNQDFFIPKNGLPFEKDTALNYFKDEITFLSTDSKYYFKWTNEAYEFYKELIQEINDKMALPF